LLADPSVFPKEFRQWVTDHASNSVDIAKGQVHGLINSSGQLIFSNASWDQLGAVLVGVILPWAASLPPTNNWLVCNGSFYPETTYPKLFALIGHAHDPFANTGNFAVPDLQGRAIYGFDPNGTPGSPGNMPFASRDSGAPGGRGWSHHHNVSISNHQHGMSHVHGLGYGGVRDPGTGTLVNVVTGAGSNTNTSGPSFTDTSPAGAETKQTSGAPPLDGPGFYALTYIIATGNMPT
jgi:microcystin-dependent protein